MGFNEVNRLERLCEKYKVISFDIFDTLLKRDVYAPKDVFEMVGNIKNAVNFTEKRIEAEKAAREKATNREATLDEIYDEIAYPKEIADELKCTELYVERRVLHVNYPIYEVYQECLRKGKTVYLCSDMYLPRAYLIDVLKENNIIGYKNLYISSEHRKNKKSGELFKLLCSEEKIEFCNILHIGDSKLADYISPRILGMQAFHIKRNLINVSYLRLDNDSNYQEKIFYSFINNRIVELEKTAERLGYEIVGPIIYLYCEWLHSFAADSCSTVWFAARDMYFFYKAYVQIYGNDEKEKYIYLSRKSLRPAYTYVKGDIRKSNELLPHDKFSLRDLLIKMGYSSSAIDSYDSDALCKKYYADELDSYDDLIEIFERGILKDEELQRSERVIAYLKEQGLFSSDILFADVGWHGRTQLVLSEIQNYYSKSYRIRGAYVGSMTGTSKRLGESHYASLFFDEKNPSMFSKGILIFERLIAAPEGTTVDYKYDFDGVKPMLSKADSVDSYIEDIQNGALRFISDYKESFVSKSFLVPKELVKKAFEELISNPRSEELREIGDLQYDTGDGYIQLAHPRKIAYYFLNPKALYSDLRYSPWRIGFLKRLIKIPINYGRLYSYLRKMAGKDN